MSTRSFMRGLRLPFAVAATLLIGGAAQAHVSLAGPGFAKQNQVLTFSIGHGCSGADTYKLSVAIPPEVTSVRGMPSTWGPADVQADDTGAVTAVVWTKDTVRPADDQFYQMSIRVGVPDLPFQTLYFPATQYCRSADGAESVVEWKALPDEIARAPKGEEPEPAPSLAILPPRNPGWNKFKVASTITDLSIFKDALIVWAGDAAYSANPATAEQIENEDGVSTLDKLDAGAEIWVKY